MTSMAAPQQQTSIGGEARLCLLSFHRCLESAGSVHPREFSLVEDQFARFSIWSASIGVFSPGRASMDHRLREAPDARDVVVGLLETLLDQITRCSSTLQRIGTSRQHNASDVVTAEDENLNEALRGIASEIGMLYRITNTIRRASKEAQHFKAAKSFRITDDEGNDAEPLLKELFSSYIRDRFPGSMDNLRERLAVTMLLRRKRILYRRSRYGKTSIGADDVKVSQPKIQPPQTRIQVPVNSPERPEDFAHTGADVDMSARSIAKSLAVSATTLAPDDYKKASAPSVVSVTKTVALASHEDLVFPPPPSGRVKQKYRQIKRQREEHHKEALNSIPNYSLYEEHHGEPPLGAAAISSVRQAISSANASLRDALKKDWDDCCETAGEIFCPFCFYALPGRYLINERKWKSHITNDLDAYVCLFDECDKAEMLYSHSSDWLKHMRGHALRWRCSSKSHFGLDFSTADDYIGHMRTVHGGSFTEAQLEVLAKRNARAIEPMFQLCPLCGAEESKDSLEGHIVGHLRLLALKSLPPYEDEGSESSAEAKDSLGNSRPSSRSTVKNDFERHGKLVFYDFGENPNAGPTDSGNQSEQSPYSGWGGFRSYISRFPAGAPMAEVPAGSPLLFPERDIVPIPDFPGGEAVEPAVHLQSSDFVESALFDGVASEDRRRFEWGFVVDACFGPPDEQDHDPIIQSIREGQGGRSTLEAEAAEAANTAIKVMEGRGWGGWEAWARWREDEEELPSPYVPFDTTYGH